MDPDLNEEGGIKMEDSREEHWRDVADDCEDKIKNNYLSWNLYTGEKEGLIKR